MRFGGHETFPIREGWLHKGLTLLMDDPTKLDDDYASDYLGVGRNMAKSIRHWLLATKLAERTDKEEKLKGKLLKPTQLARTISERDSYFLEKGTWWALHIGLVNNPDNAITWSWFFNHFTMTSFKRDMCVDQLRRHVRQDYVRKNKKRLPKIRTLQREVACLLATYSQDIPPAPTDPEDGADCPFRELGLIAHFSESGRYVKGVISPATIPPEMIPYAILVADQNLGHQKSAVEKSVREGGLMKGGPGHCFGFELETFFEACTEAERLLRPDRFSIPSQAGERTLKFEPMRPHQWLNAYYDRVRIEDQAAA